MMQEFIKQFEAKYPTIYQAMKKGDMKAKDAFDYAYGGWLLARENLPRIVWFTEDHLTDKSATTYDVSVAERWIEKGWKVTAISGLEIDAK